MGLDKATWVRLSHEQMPERIAHWKARGIAISDVLPPVAMEPPQFHESGVASVVLRGEDAKAFVEAVAS